MSIWNTFFDNPGKRPHQRHTGTLVLNRVRAQSTAQCATLRLENFALGPFSGRLEFHFFTGTPLIQLQAVVMTKEDSRAFVYECGLRGTPESGLQKAVWMDTEKRVQSKNFPGIGNHQPLAVRHRIITAECKAGSIACFPPPHQFQFPRDYTDNLKFVWIGSPETNANEIGFGLRQPSDGGGAFVPWFNAPPGTEQKLTLFLLPDPGSAEQAMKESLRYTRGDRFERLPEHLTFN